MNFYFNMKSHFNKIIFTICFFILGLNNAQAQKEIKIDNDALIAVFDSNHVKITECDFAYDEINKGRFSRITLKSGFVARGRIVGIHKKGVFLVSKDFTSKKMLLGFYPFAEMEYFSFGHSYGNFVLKISAVATVVSTVFILCVSPQHAAEGLVAGLYTGTYGQPFYAVPYFIVKNIKKTYWNSRKINNKKNNLYQFMITHPKEIRMASDFTSLTNPQ